MYQVFFIIQRLDTGEKVGKTANMPPLSIREQCLSLWDRDSSRSDKHCLLSKREGWNEEKKTLKNSKFSL